MAHDIRRKRFSENNVAVRVVLSSGAYGARGAAITIPMMACPITYIVYRRNLTEIIWWQLSA